jgi:hypothetical protein
MSQLAAERPARGSNKPSLGGLIKSSLVYALLSAIPPTKRATVARPAGAAGAQSDQRSRRSAELKRDGSAAQDGRGRHASAPWQIPWAGWKDILWRTYARIGDDRLLAVAAGVVFYGLLALFPAITAFVSLYGLFAKGSTIAEHLSLASGVLPAGAMEIIQEQVNRITAKGDAKLSIAFAASLGLALWSANAGMKAVIDALECNVRREAWVHQAQPDLSRHDWRRDPGPPSGSRGDRRAADSPIVHGFRRVDRNAASLPALASTARFGDLRSSRFVPIWTKQRVPAMGVAHSGECFRCRRVACGFSAAVLVFGEFCELRCDLWLARRCHWHDDLDVDVVHRDFARCRTQLRGRASNCA